jgi:DnaJ-class molecular chaperone
LDERELRNVFRARARELHPDLNSEAARASEITVYELNNAYETVRKVLT